MVREKTKRRNMKRIGERERERKSGGKNLVGMISLALPSCFIHHHSHRDKIGLVSFSSLGSLYRGHSMNSKEILFSFHYNLCVRARRRKRIFLEQSSLVSFSLNSCFISYTYVNCKPWSRYILY